MTARSEVPAGDVEKTVALMRISESVTVSGPLLCALLAEWDRRGQIEQRARKVEDGTVTNGNPWRQNAEIADWILRGGES